MAYAAYRDSFNANSSSALPARCEAATSRMVLDVVVPSRDAFQVRCLLAGCPGTGVMRCVPQPQDSQVRLEIQLPQASVPEVMHLLMSSIPTGEVGSVVSWKRHLTSHGMTHGF